MNTFEIQRAVRRLRNAEGLFQEIQIGPGSNTNYTLGIFSAAVVSLLLEKKYEHETTELRSEIAKSLFVSNHSFFSPFASLRGPTHFVLRPSFR